MLFGPATEYVVRGSPFEGMVHREMPVLTPQQAGQLLARFGAVEITDISVAATTNDVFRVVTRSHGVFFIKFHTARWYADQPDTAFVAEREAAMPELLRKRGLPLPYTAWADTSRSIVSRSVFICGELEGTPVTEAAVQFPAESDEIMRAFGRYLRRLHEIELTTPGILHPQHARLAPSVGTIPHVESWDDHPLHHPEHFQREALAAVARAERGGSLPREIAEQLTPYLARSAEVLRPDYQPPHLTVGNCHAYHFHVAPAASGWEVQGCYDFEAASAGDSTIDLVELEVTLMPALGSSRWREPFLAGYGRRPGLEGYALRLIYHLLWELENPYTEQIPDRDWLHERWLPLLNARAWDDLTWYPTAEDA